MLPARRRERRWKKTNILIATKCENMIVQGWSWGFETEISRIELWAFGPIPFFNRPNHRTKGYGCKPIFHICAKVTEDITFKGLCTCAVSTCVDFVVKINLKLSSCQSCNSWLLKLSHWKLWAHVPKAVRFADDVSTLHINLFLFVTLTLLLQSRAVRGGAP